MRSAPFVRFTAVLTAVLLLLFSVTFPVARALDPVTISAAVVGVSAVIAVGSILAGLGVLPLADAADQFNTLVNDVVSSLGTAWTFVSSAGVTMVKMLSIKSNYYAQRELVQAVCDYLFRAEVVKETFVVSEFVDNTGYRPGVAERGYRLILDQYPFASGQRLYIYNYWPVAGASSLYFFALAPADVSPDDAKEFTFSARYRYVYSSASDTLEFLTDEYTLGKCYYVGYVDGLEYTAQNLQLGDVGIDLDDAVYSTWVENPLVSAVYGGSSDDSGTSNGDGDDNVPIGLSHLPLLLLSDWVGLNQQYIQAGGQSELAPEDVIDLGELVELDPETVPDDLLNSQPDTNPDTNPDTGADTDPNPGSMQLDLTRFFPFCIPFDLYRLLSCLVAEPEAPKFEFALPMLGEEPVRFEVDLSAWDDVASTLRMFETAAFIVGLIFVTNKFIKW